MTRICLLGGPRRSEPTMIEWRKNIMNDRVTFDAAWTKMGLHHDVPRTHLVDEVLRAAKHFQRATSDYVFPSPKTGGQIRLHKDGQPPRQGSKCCQVHDA